MAGAMIISTVDALARQLAREALNATQKLNTRPAFGPPVPGPQGNPGPDGPQGPPGTSGTNAATAAIWASLASTWILTHSLGRIPASQVVLSSGEQVIADVVATETTINVTFPSPQQGYVLVW